MNIEFENIFKDFTRISVNRSGNAAIRGHPSSKEYSYVRKGGSEKTCSIIELPIHSITHFDIVKNVPLDSANEYYKPQYFNRIAIINLCYKQEIINQYLIQEEDGLYDNIIYPFLDLGRINNNSSNMPEEIILNILNQLKITETEIESFFESEKDTQMNLKNFDGIIFRTDWSDFRYGNWELNNPFFELFHAFLIHPYINYDTIILIKNKYPNLKLIASDTPSLSNPAVFIDPGHAFPNIRKVYYRMYNEGIISKQKDIIEAFIENKVKYFIKNVGNLDNVQKENELVTHGDLMLIPVPTLSEPTGMCCELYFRRHI